MWCWSSALLHQRRNANASCSDGIIAIQVEKLYVIQRTPMWVLPRKNFVYWKWVKRMFALLPFLQHMYYSLLYWINETRFFIVFKSIWPINAIPQLVSR